MPIDLAEITPMAGRYVTTGSQEGKRLTAVSDRVPLRLPNVHHVASER